MTFQSLSSCCSVDLYFSRLEVTVRGMDTWELGRQLKFLSQIVVPKDWLTEQPLSFITSPSLCPKFTIVEVPSQEHLHHLPRQVGRPLFPLLPTRECSRDLLGGQTGPSPRLLSFPAAGRSQDKPPTSQCRKQPNGVMILFQERDAEVHVRFWSSHTLSCWVRERERIFYC